MAGNGKQPRDDAELFASLADYPYRCTVEDGKIRALTLPGTDTELEARILNLPQMDLSTLWFTGEGALRLYLARFSNPQLEAVYLRDTDLSTSIAELLARCQRLHTIELQPEGAINSR